MKKEEIENLETSIRNLTTIMLVGFIALTLLIIGLYFKEGSSSSVTTNTSSSQTDTDYDVSKMIEVDVDGAMALFNNKGTYILYIGRSDCSVCISTVPILNQVQTDLGYQTYYFDLNKTTNFKTEMAELAKKFDVELDDGNIGELFIDKGYTPTIIVIKDGKAVDGFIGYKDADSMKTIFKKYLS